MVMGRPTKYTEDMPEKVLEYIDSYDTPLPTIAGLAIHIGVAKSTIFKWLDESVSADFSDSVERISECQEVIALSGGLKGEFNSSIVKLVLANHGYHDKREVKQDVTQNIAMVSDEPMTQEQWEGKFGG